MSNANFIQEAIFKAVDVILEKRLKTLRVNYCVSVIIQNDEPQIDENEETYYTVNYQDMLIRAYPISKVEGPLYKKGDLVYMLIINGDFNKKKLILSKI